MSFSSLEANVCNGKSTRFFFASVRKLYLQALEKCRFVARPLCRVYMVTIYRGNFGAKLAALVEVCSNFQKRVLIYCTLRDAVFRDRAKVLVLFPKL